MWFFDPNKPPDREGYAQKCGGGEGKYNTTFQPWKYCSGPKPFIWLQLEVANATVSDFTHLVISVKDSANNTLLTYDCVANNNLVVDLSSIQSQINGQPLNVEVSYALASGSNIQPEIRAYYHASPLEFCYKSKHQCPIQQIKNPVNVNIPDVPKVETVVNLPADKCQLADSGGGQSGNSGGNQSGNSEDTSTANQGDNLTGGLAGGLSGGLVGGIIGDSGTNTNIERMPKSNNGLVVLEKDGKVQIIPEVKQRCYWRPKQKTQEAKLETQSSKKKIIKNNVKKPSIQDKDTAKKPLNENIKKKVVKKHLPKKVYNPKEEMEYVCEPEK